MQKAGSVAERRPHSRGALPVNHSLLVLRQRSGMAARSEDAHWQKYGKRERRDAQDRVQREAVQKGCWVRPCVSVCEQRRGQAAVSVCSYLLNGAALCDGYITTLMQPQVEVG